MKNKNIDLFQTAKNYAFLLLKFRPRSEKELYQRLKKKRFDDSIINEVISFLKDRGFIDDNYFTKAWIESRLKKPLGFKKIEQELKFKGINKEIIDTQIQELKKNYSEEDIILKLAQEKFNKLKVLELKKAKRRVFTYLVRRGFSPEVVIDAINQLTQMIAD